MTELPPRLRQSLLRWSDLCLHAVKLYIDFDGGAASPEKNRGSLGHHVFERLARTVLEHGEGAFLEEDELLLLDQGTKDDVHTVAGRIASVTAAVVDEVADEHPELTVALAQKDRIRQMAYHWAVATRLDPEQVVALEQQFVIDVEGIPCVGTVDVALMADNMAEVRDYKTGLFVPDQETYDESFQPAMYSALLLFGQPVSWPPCAICGGKGWTFGMDIPADEHPVEARVDCPMCDGRGYVEKRGTCLGSGIERIRSREVYPRLLNPDNKLHSRDRVRSRAEVADWLNDLAGRVRQLIQAAATDEWPATRNRQCGWCPAGELCPIPFPIAEGPITDEETARTLAAGWSAEGQRRTAVGRMLRGWVEAHGPLRFGEGLVLVLEPDARMAMRMKEKPWKEGME